MKKIFSFFVLMCLFFLSQAPAEEAVKIEAFKRELVVKLYEIGAIKFGSYVLKSGITSPIYIDLRLVVSYPKLLEQIGQAIWEEIQETPHDCICGVPYTALPIATAISLNHDVPMVMRRKEVKNYGTNRMIEGQFQPGQKCIVIEDLVTSGSSILETAKFLKDVGLKVSDVVVLIDRKQGGKEVLSDSGYQLHSVLSLVTLLEILEEEHLISQETMNSVIQFLQENRVK